MKNYSELSYEELRELLLNGELEHEYMTEEDYICLYDYETELADPNLTVLDFCDVGLSKLEKYKDCENIHVDMDAIFAQVERESAEVDYGDLSYEKLRELLLNGELEHERMAEEDYICLYDYELELADPNLTVLNFCDEGLARLEKYKDCENIHVDMDAIFAQVERESETPLVLVKSKRAKRIFIAAAALVAVFIVVAFSFTDYFKQLLGDSIQRTDDVRFYDSFENLIKTEKLNILYPHGYNFADFEVINSSVDLTVLARSRDPYIEFEVIIGTDFWFDSYDYEANGIKHNIVIHDGLYEAVWVSEADYYSIVVEDRTVLSDIIKNLQRSTKQ